MLTFMHGLLDLTSFLLQLGMLMFESFNLNNIHAVLSNFEN